MLFFIKINVIYIYCAQGDYKIKTTKDYEIKITKQGADIDWTTQYVYINWIEIYEEMYKTKLNIKLFDLSNIDFNNYDNNYDNHLDYPQDMSFLKNLYDFCFFFQGNMSDINDQKIKKEYQADFMQQTGINLKQYQDLETNYKKYAQDKAQSGLADLYLNEGTQILNQNLNDHQQSKILEGSEKFKYLLQFPVNKQQQDDEQNEKNLENRLYLFVNGFANQIKAFMIKFTRETEKILQILDPQTTIHKYLNAIMGQIKSSINHDFNNWNTKDLVKKAEDLIQFLQNKSTLSKKEIKKEITEICEKITLICDSFSQEEKQNFKEYLDFFFLQAGLVNSLDIIPHYIELKKINITLSKTTNHQERKINNEKVLDVLENFCFEPSVIYENYSKILYLINEPTIEFNQIENTPAKQAIKQFIQNTKAIEAIVQKVLVKNGEKQEIK